QHTEPTTTTVYPILADPKQQPSQVGVVNTQGRHDGETWEEIAPNGDHLQHTLVPGTGGQTVDTHVTRSDGTFADIRSVDDGNGGATVWADESTGTASYGTFDEHGNLDAVAYEQSPVLSEDPVAVSYTPAGGEVSEFTTANPDGTVSHGLAAQTASNQVTTLVENPDQSTSTITSTDTGQGTTSELVQDAAGTRVRVDNGPVTEIDELGNDISVHDQPSVDTGRFYNPDTGQWVNGAVVEGRDTPIYRLDDGSLVYGQHNEEGTTDWVIVTNDGGVAAVRELEWDTNGAPIVTAHDPIEHGTTQADNGVAILTPSDVAGITYGIGTLAPLEMAKHQTLRDLGTGHLDDLDTAKTLRSVKIAGKALGPIGTGLSIGADMKSGESMQKAVTTNLVGVGAGAATGALVTVAAGAIAATAPVWATGLVIGGVSTAVGLLATKGAKLMWDKVAE
ncbi:hypothetical protein, partial [Corynebacterium pelargi]